MGGDERYPPSAAGLLTNLRFWFGLAITAAFLGLLLARVDFGSFADALADANYALLAPAVAVYFGALYFRALRWKHLLRPFALTRTARLYPVVVVGYMANNLLPMRIGEVVRSYYLSTREPVRGATGLATVVVERVFDGLTLLLLLAAAALFLPLSGLTDRVSDAVNLPPWLIAAAVAAPFAAVLTLMALAAMRPGPFLAGSAWLAGRLPQRVAPVVRGLAERFIQGFEGLHRPGRVALVFALTLPVWLAEGAMYYVIGLAFGLHDVLGGHAELAAAMLVVTSMSNLATSIPSSPGSVGPFELFAALSLEVLGVGRELASAYAVVLHVALLLPVIAAGLLHLAARRISLGELTRGRAAGAAGERL